MSWTLNASGSIDRLLEACTKVDCTGQPPTLSAAAEVADYQKSLLPMLQERLKSMANADGSPAYASINAAGYSSGEALNLSVNITKLVGFKL